MFKKIIIALFLLLGLAALYLMFWPVSVDPAAWDAPVNRGYVGDFAPNTELANLERLSIGDLHGPEDVVAQETPDGLRLYVSSQEGKILVLDPATNTPADFADTQGSALGMEMDSAGNLIIADAYKGLLSVSPDGQVTTLTDTVDGSPILYADDLDIADDGVIYFSDASTKFGAEASGSTMAGSLLEIMEHRRTGRLLAYDPATKTTRVVADNFSFSNGVAMHPDGDVLLVETGEYRVHKINPQTGVQSIFIDNLPGFPDNINRGPDGTLLLGLISQRSDWLDENAKNVAMRKLAMRLPASMRPKAVSYGLIVHLAADGSVIQTWQDPSRAYPQATGAIIHDGHIYVSSLSAENLAFKKLN
jgi:sugar lactone lactonase YvrE